MEFISINYLSTGKYWPFPLSKYIFMTNIQLIFCPKLRKTYGSTLDIKVPWLFDSLIGWRQQMMMKGILSYWGAGGARVRGGF